MALELVLVLLSRSPVNNFTKELEHKAVALLYSGIISTNDHLCVLCADHKITDLPHPPSTHMGQQWSFRSADGSGNSRLDPDMGKSFTPYSRSCTSTHPLPPNELPDPGLVFDLLVRRDKVGYNTLSPSQFD